MEFIISDSLCKFDWEKFSKCFEELATGLSILSGGFWILFRFILEKELHPKINISCDINFIGKQGDEWLIELVSTLENVGKAQHRMKVFTFELDMLYPQEKLLASDEWRGQVDFPHSVKKGSFLSEKCKFFFVDPGTTAKYSYVTSVSNNASYLQLHCTFIYLKSDYSHSAEKTVKLPPK